MGGFEFFGVNEFGARFFSAVMGVCTALIAFHLGRLLFSARVGFWAGLITCSTIVFTVSARAATVDSALTLRHRAGDAAVRDGQEGAQGSGSAVMSVRARIRNPQVRTSSSFIIILHHSLSWPYAARMYACIGLAVLAKGPVGMLLPLGRDGTLHARGQRLAEPLAVGLADAAHHRAGGHCGRRPAVVHRGRPRDPRGMAADVLRGVQPSPLPAADPDARRRCSSSALAVWSGSSITSTTSPASCSASFPGRCSWARRLVDTVREIRGQKSEVRVRSEVRGQKSETACGFASVAHWRDGCLLASCWFGVWFVFWSVCKTKLPHYLLPAYPALALLVACWIDRWLGEKRGQRTRGRSPVGDRGTPGFRRSWRAWGS